MWNREIAERYWADRPRYWNPRKEREMRCYVMNRENAKFFEKEDGSRVWNVPSAAEASERLGEMAVVVALDERNFNESLNSYVNGKLYKQLAYDERNGWVS